MTLTRLEQRPGLGRLYAKAVTSARGRHGDRLPDLTVELPEATIDRDRLASYADVCGFRKSDILPATYPHVLAFPLAVSIMVDPSFPFALPGLVHVANRITQKRALRADERLTLRVSASELREHPRGRQFDMLTEASVDADPVWTESSTYLRRDPHPALPRERGRVNRPEFGESPGTWVDATPLCLATSIRSISIPSPLASSAFGAPSPTACGSKPAVSPPSKADYPTR